MQSSKSKRSNGYFFDDPVSHIMLSYSWSNKEHVNQLVSRLDAYIHFWRDKSNLSGAKDLWTAIANAIHKSEFVVAILTQEYVESDSCTNELNYALNIKKPVVPVFIDPNFRPTGNVGLRTSKLFYIVYNDIIENPLLFVKHLNAMSAKIHNIDLNEINTFQASYLKHSIFEIERMINHNIRDKIFDFNNNNSTSPSTQLQQNSLNNNNNNNNNNTIRNKVFIMNNIYNSSKCTKIERGDIENINVRNINSRTKNEFFDQHQNFLNKLEFYNNSVEENDFANSLNVYGMQANRSGNLVNYIDLKIPYKLGDSMYSINESDELGKKLTDLNLAGNDKSFDMNARNGFNIHQAMPDPNNYDIYTKENDEICSFVCQGKRVEILDSDYQDVSDLIFKPKEENTTLELAFDLRDDVLSCFLHIEDDLMLIASEKGEFNLMKPNKSKLTFVRCVLSPKYNGNDYEFYKKGEKTLVDICLDSSGNLLILNRWNFKEEKVSSTQTIETKYTIELFNFNRKKVDGISYMRTICCLNDEESSSPKPANFTRIFNDERKNCIILVDSANNKIYWYKKSNGAKKRCLKSQDNTLENPKSLAMVVDEQNSIDIIFICTKSGLVASSQNFTIKHEVIMPADIYYDLFDKSIYFISSYKIFQGSLFDNERNKNSYSPTTNSFSSEDLDIKYKLMFSCNSIENKRDLKRIVTSKNFIYILCGPELDSNSSTAIMFAYTKFKN